MDHHARDTDRGPCLVIGYGNPLRRDDAVGPLAAETVARWNLPGVVTIAAHQLLPEFAGPLATAGLAVFVDARIDDGNESLVEHIVIPCRTSSSIGHVSDPGRLLALARDAFGSCPRAWLITVPAADLDPGQGLSPRAAAGLEAALLRIAELLGIEGERGELGPELPGAAVYRASPA